MKFGGFVYNMRMCLAFGVGERMGKGLEEIEEMKDGAGRFNAEGITADKSHLAASPIGFECS